MQLYKKCGLKLNIKHIDAHTNATDMDSRINDICDKTAKKCAKDKADLSLRVIGGSSALKEKSKW